MSSKIAYAIIYMFQFCFVAILTSAVCIWLHINFKVSNLALELKKVENHWPKATSEENTQGEPYVFV